MFSSALFRFPNPVNETSARLVAGGVLAMAATTVILDEPCILFPLTYGFAARVAAGPTLSPLGQLATTVITPRLEVSHKSSPGPPKRLAQGVGLTLSATATVLTGPLLPRPLGALRPRPCRRGGGGGERRLLLRPQLPRRHQRLPAGVRGAARLLKEARDGAGFPHPGGLHRPQLSAHRQPPASD